MDNKVGPILGSYKPREAEGADTRYGLVKQEGFGRRRGRHDQDSDTEGLSEDVASVSVEALLLFLENYMMRRFGGQPEGYELDKTPEYSGQRGAANIEALRFKAVQAVEAYKHAAHVSRKVVARKAAHGSVPDEGLGRDNSENERDIVIGLIRDLRVLADYEVGSLRIERGDGFIESLAVAVMKAKQSFSF